MKSAAGGERGREGLRGSGPGSWSNLVWPEMEAELATEQGRLWGLWPGRKVSGGDDSCGGDGLTGHRSQGALGTPAPAAQVCRMSLHFGESPRVPRVLTVLDCPQFCSPQEVG